MSYLVFARKYRPLVYDDVVGQQHITQTLRKAITNDRVAHAYIFTGTRGVGKTTTARILARALNCDQGPTAEPCGECESCKQIIAGSSFDVLEIDGASNRGVDDVRQLRENITYSSMSGKHRVIVIDEVHMLTREAFNALLKTLEEPPPRVIFIFATTEPQRIPATIHSRCQRYDFRRISAEQIQAQLAKICENEGVSYEHEGLALVARKADGSMRDALSLLDQVYSYCQGEIHLEDVRTVLGVVGSDIYGRLMQAVHNKQPEPALSIVQDVLFKGYDLREFVVGLEEHIRDLLLVTLPGMKESAADSELRSQAELFSEQTLLRMAEYVRRSERDLRQSAYPRFLIETLLLRLVYMDDTVSLEQLLRIIGGGASAGQEGEPVQIAEAASKKKTLTHEAVPDTPPVASSSTSTAVEEPPTVSDGPSDVDAGSFDTDAHPGQARDVQAEWREVLPELGGERPNSGGFLAHGRGAPFGRPTLDVRFAPVFRFHFDELSKQHNRALIERKLADFAGVKIDLHMTLEPQTHDPEVVDFVSHMGAGAGSSIEDDLQNEPIIKTVLEAFDGEIIQ